MYAAINMLSTIVGMYMSAISTIAHSDGTDISYEQLTNNVNLSISLGLGWEMSYVQADVQDSIQSWLEFFNDTEHCPF